LYYKNKETYSSITGGLITLICGALFSIYGIWLIVSVFTSDQWTLDFKSQRLSYLVYEGGKFVEKCDDK
jgi:hypothetical protein